MFIDIETFSGTEIRAGVYRYSSDPTFEILMAAYSIDGKTFHLAIGEDEIREIPGLFDPSVIKIAHNAQFERICLGVLDSACLDPEQWEDTMAIAAENGYPQSLSNLAVALGASEKDTAGTRLINMFCKPQRGKRIRPKDKPEQWEQFKEYCLQDVRTLVDVYKRLPGWPTEMERQIYLTDQRINDRGIKVDLPLARKAVEAAEQNRAEQTAELTALTDVVNPGSTQQLLAWLQGQGVTIANLRAATVRDVLANASLTDDQRRVLELRQDLALVASKKYTAALNSTSADGRLRGAFRFFGAHTGRWAGRGVQLHNLPRASVDNTDAAILDLMMDNGATAQTLKGLVRPLFLGPFTVVDYSAIEARVLAWLSGEQWVLDAFETGRDIYEETAQRMGGFTRDQGKVAVLALGYAGGINSLKVMMGDQIYMHDGQAVTGGTIGAAVATGVKPIRITDDELQIMVNRWRMANPRIVQFWNDVDRKFWTGGLAGRLVIKKHGDDREMILPSGRALIYHGVRRSDRRMSFDDPKGHRTDTYGGRLCENVTQAVARDILAESLVRLEDRGYQVEGHVHDELIVAGDDLDGVVKVVEEQPDWANGLPLSAEGQICNRYQKL